MPPVFIWLDRHANFYRVLPLLFCLSILIPRPEDDSLILQNFVHFTSVYVLGMFCCHYRDAVLFAMKQYWRWMLLLATVLIALEVLLKSMSSPLTDIIYLNTASKSILSVVFIYLLWRFDNAFSAKFHAIMGKLANLSFGIYFLHAYIIYVYMFALKYLNALIGKNVLFLMFSLLVILLLTISILLIGQKAFGKKSRYLFGC